MFLEIATTAGALVGALLALVIHAPVIAIIFGVILIFSAFMSLRKKSEVVLQGQDSWAQKLKLNGTYPTQDGIVKYGCAQGRLGFFNDAFCRCYFGFTGYRLGLIKSGGNG